MTMHAPLHLALKKVPFSPGTAYEMCRRKNKGMLTWIIKGVDSRLWIDIPGLQKFMRSHAPFWGSQVDMPGLLEIARNFDFQEAAKS